MALPIAAVRKPTTLNGLTNGKLPLSALATIGVGNAVMEVTAARAFRAMFAAARSQLGVTIKHVGDYRSFEAQLSLFLSRYKPVSSSVYSATSSRHRKYWAQARQYGYSSVYWVKKSNSLATAAVPGGSNHGWGLALDIAEEYDSDSAADPISTRFVSWLSTYASRYGISAELQSEPWHWRYFAGDSLPKAVLDFEKGTNPPPPVKPPDPVIPPSGGSSTTVQFQTETLRVGSKGPEVKRCQEIMKGISAPHISTDGSFGPQTDEAVKNWQRFFSVPGGADGIVGASTWESLIEVWLATA